MFFSSNVFNVFNVFIFKTSNNKYMFSNSLFEFHFLFINPLLQQSSLVFAKPHILHFQQSNRIFPIKLQKTSYKLICELKTIYMCIIFFYT